MHRLIIGFSGIPMLETAAIRHTTDMDLSMLSIICESKYYTHTRYNKNCKKYYKSKLFLESLKTCLFEFRSRCLIEAV